MCIRDRLKSSPLLYGKYKAFKKRFHLLNKIEKYKDNPLCLKHYSKMLDMCGSDKEVWFFYYALLRENIALDTKFYCNILAKIKRFGIYQYDSEQLTRLIHLSLIHI